MKHESVTSSNIESIGFDEQTNTLEVKFKNGSHYSYHDVSKDHHAALMKASSIGQHLHAHIKNKFTCKKIK